LITSRAKPVNMVFRYGREFGMGRFRLLLAGFGFLLFGGCAGVTMFTAKTKATVTTPDGFTASWESDKEHQGLEAEYDPVTGRFKIKVEKSGTPDAAIAAALQSQTKMIELLGSALKASGKVP